MTPPRNWLRALTRKAPGEGDRKRRRPPYRDPGGPPMHRTGMGLLLIAIGRREGLEDFGNTADAYLASLAPLVAFALVSCVIAAASGHVRAAIQVFLMLICSWLAPAVISHPIARAWRQDAAWPRYANIVNWWQMLLFLVLGVVTLTAKAAIAAGLPQHSVLATGFVVLVAYAVWFHWFVARGVLKLSRWRTAVLLVAVALGTNAIVSVPLAATGEKLPAFVLP